MIDLVLIKFVYVMSKRSFIIPKEIYQNNGEQTMCLHCSIGSSSNRPQVKSAPGQIGPSQIGPKSNRPTNCFETETGLNAPNLPKVYSGHLKT
jgi:hypothetical protein